MRFLNDILNIIIVHSFRGTYIKTSNASIMHISEL